MKRTFSRHFCRSAECVLFVALNLLATASPVEAATTDAMQTVCKVIRPVAGAQSGGTGFIFRDDDRCLWIMTAAHVLGDYRTCHVRLYVNGEESLPAVGIVVQVNYNRAHITREQIGIRDLAIIKVNKDAVRYLGDIKVAQLAAPNTVVKRAETIFSVGCPDMNWPSAWLGQVQQSNAESFIFGPNPIPGRSGSPIFDKEGKHVVGVIIWYGDSYGRAVSIDGIYEHFPELAKSTGDVKNASAKTSHLSQW